MSTKRLKTTKKKKWLHIVSEDDGKRVSGVLEGIVTSEKYSKRVLRWFDWVVDNYAIGHVEALRIGKKNTDTYKIAYKDIVGSIFYLHAYPD
jgi:hypothetical protein